MSLTPPAAARAVGRLLGRGRLLAIGLLVALLALRVWDPAPVEAFRLRIFDIYQELAPREETGFPVVIVDVDEASLKELGQWPWPRTVLAELVDRLAAAGAAAVGFDIVFAEPDRTSPEFLSASLAGLPPATAEALRGLPSNDAVFADSLARFGRAVLGLAGFGSSEIAAEASKTPPGPGASVAEIGGDPRPYLIGYAGLLENLEVIAASAAGRGVFSLAPEVDGVVRRVPAFVRVGSTLVPGLSLETLRVATGQRSYGVHVNEAGVAAVVIAGVAIPTDEAGMIHVPFGPHDARRFVSAADVIAGRTDPARLAGRLVLVGTSAAGLRDLRATPVAASMPGVEVHAQLLESVLSRTHLTRPNYALGLELGLTLGAGLALLLLMPLVGARWTLALLVLLVLALGGGSWLAFAQSRQLVDASFPTTSAILLYALLAYSGFTVAERQRKQISRSFEHYLSPVLVQRLARDPAAGLRLGGETKVMTVAFADIRDFTSLSERYRNDPQGLTRVINRVLTVMGDAVLENEGTIDKYIGDALMSFWNAPIDIERHAAKACGAALQMMESVGRINAELRAEQGEGAPQIRIGIGINTGECVVGNVGSIRRLSYSVLGDPVNLASRLEGQSKTYGVPIVISEDTRREAEDFAAVELDLIAVKGRNTAVRVFGLLGHPDQAGTQHHRELVARQARLLAAYRAQDWDAAVAEIEAGLDAAPELARLYELYRGRIDAYRKNPPDPGWNGVFVATEK